MEQIRGVLPAFKIKFLGDGVFDLESLKRHQASLLVFYKYECDTSQFLIDLLNKLWNSLPEDRRPLYLVSQDTADETRAFAREKKLPIPVALDYPEYFLSHKLGFSVVPAVYLVDASANILGTSLGFVRDELAHLWGLLLSYNGIEKIPFWRDIDNVPPLRPS